MESEFQSIPLNIAGPSYQDRSRPLSVQETKNLYHEVVESGKSKYVVKSFPGQVNLGSTTPADDRGMHQMGEIAYRIVGEILYRVTSNGIHEALGFIQGYDRCIFADDGLNLFIVCHLRVYKYSREDFELTSVTDPDITGALSVTFINNQFAYTHPKLTVFSDVGDGSSASGLNAVGEETSPDDLVRDYAFDQILYRFGKRTTPNWYNSGVGTPPFERIEGQTFNVGLGAIHSVANTRDYIYWLGSDLNVYRARGGQEQIISTAAISGAIQGYSHIIDAFGSVITIDDKSIYVLTFPHEDKTWCINEELGKDGWFELSEGITNGRYNAGSILDVYSKTLIGDRSNGNLNYLDFGTYTQAGEQWRRRRIISTVDGDILQHRGHRIQMSKMEFIIDTGIGLLQNQGENPRIMLEASYDGGKSWDEGTWLRIGRLGETNIRAEWCSMKSFYSMVVRLTTSDPIDLSIYSAAIDVRLAGE